MGVVIKLTKYLSRLKKRDSVDVKILFITLGGIGDVIMKTPAIINLRRAFPKAYIAALAHTGPASEVLMNCPYLNEIIHIGEEKPKYKQNLLELMRLIIALRRKRFDMVITGWAGLSLWAALFAYLTGAPIRVGFNKGGRGFLHTIRVPITSKKHTVEYNLDLIRALGIEIKEIRPKMWPKEDDYKKAEKFLIEHNVRTGDLLVGIYPGSERLGEGKRWFPERYAKVANRLAGKYNAKVIIFGGPLEVEVARVIRDSSKVEIIDATGKFSINETAALIKRCNLFICNDGGVMHIAEAMDVPTISIWGPTDPERSAPYGSPERNIILRKEDIECAPCYNYRPINCKHRKCLRLITVDDVMEAVGHLLSEEVRDNAGIS